MKKDRNCGCQGSTPYPIYQNQVPMMPMAPIQNPMMQGMQMPMMQNTIPMQGSFQQTGIEQQLSNLNSQITNLERRVSTLENLIGSNNNYNTSNFQMM